MTDCQTRYRCWECGTECWLPERPLNPSATVRARCDDCLKPRTHRPVGTPHPRQLAEVDR
jgi:DNA-directed RNA polymerase subunit RPC12/RpoP